MQPQRLDLRYILHWTGPWHVGSGYRSAATDRLLQRTGGLHGTPFVPGSLIKGVLRHTCERLAQMLGLPAVDPHATTADQQAHLVQHFSPLHQTELIIDRLFGNRYQGECLFVENASLNPTSEIPSSSAQPDTMVRSRTAIDRATRTVKEQHLFTTELAAPTRLCGTIRARHPAGILSQEDGGFPYEYALLVAGLSTIDAVGGDKSTGLGRCTIDVDEVRWNTQPISLDTCLTSFADPEWAVMLEEVIREENRR